jgi:hypothetical protein
MTFHRFTIGDTVAANGFGIPPGPYRIVRLLPLAGGVLRIPLILISHSGRS